MNDPGLPASRHARDQVGQSNCECQARGVVALWQAVRLVEHILDAGQVILLEMLTVCGVRGILVRAAGELPNDFGPSGPPAQRVQPAPLCSEVWA